MDIVPPEQGGFSSERLERISTGLKGYIERRVPPGLITAVARRGKLVHFACHGVVDVEAGKPMEPDTIFRIFSMTKPVTAVAVMLLVEEGRLLLDAPVSEYLPEFENFKVFVRQTRSGLELEDVERDVTVRDLLVQTSGLGTGHFEGSPVVDLLREANLRGPHLSPGEFLQRLSEIPLAFQPGTAWLYSLSFDVLGHLISVVAGVPFEVFFKDRIFDPLGMVDTAFDVPEEKRERFGALYGLPESPQSDHDGTPCGGTGLVSTAGDVLRFAEMLRRGGELGGIRLLGRKTVELMTRNHLSASMLPVRLGSLVFPGCGWGLGFCVVVDAAAARALGSEGNFFWTGAAGTLFWVDPREDLVGVVMAQSMFLDWHEPVFQVFQNLVYQALTD